MSIDFGTDIYEEPIVAKTFLAEDAAEVAGGVLDSAIDCERADRGCIVENGFGFVRH